MRDKIVYFAKSLYNRGYVVGTAGNISVKLDDGTILATPTNCCFGLLKREEISVLGPNGNLIEGIKPTKEIFFHKACYEIDENIKSVVHLHSTYSTLLASSSEIDKGVHFKSFTPYFVMKVGEVGVIPYRKPGDIKIAEDIKILNNYKSILMKNHGLIICRNSLEEAVFSAEEFEETAKLWYLSKSIKINYLDDKDINELKMGK